MHICRYVGRYAYIHTYTYIYTHTTMVFLQAITIECLVGLNMSDNLSPV